jgi:hypothetical protein
VTSEGTCKPGKHKLELISSQTAKRSVWSKKKRVEQVLPGKNNKLQDKQETFFASFKKVEIKRL